MKWFRVSCYLFKVCNFSSTTVSSPNIIVKNKAWFHIDSSHLPLLDKHTKWFTYSNFRILIWKKKKYFNIERISKLILLSKYHYFFQNLNTQPQWQSLVTLNVFLLLLLLLLYNGKNASYRVKSTRVVLSWKHHIIS